MAHRKRKSYQAKPQESDCSEKNTGSGILRHYGLVAVLCLVTALIIAVVVGSLLAPDEEPAEPVFAETMQMVPTVDLPTEPAAFETQALRDELLQLGDELLVDLPEVPEALHAAALLHRDMQKMVEAEEIWQKCIELAPDRAGPYVGLASVAMELGKDELAVETLEQGFDAGCATSEMYHELAAAHTKLGNLEAAEKVSREGLKAFPQSADLQLQLGQAQIQLAKFAEAEASLLKAIAMGRKDGSIYFSLATACARQGKVEEAAQYRQEFADRKAKLAKSADQQFQDRYDETLRQMAVASTCRAATVYDHQGNLEEAEKLFLRAFDLDPSDGVVTGELGMFYRRLGRIADALVVQRRLVEIEPHNMPHYINLANLSSQLGDFETAESALKQVIAMRPDISIGYSGLAQLYLQTGNMEQARWFAEAALRQSVTGADEAARTYLVLAEACHQLGDTAAAEDALSKSRQGGVDPKASLPRGTVTQ